MVGVQNSRPDNAQQAKPSRTSLVPRTSEGVGLALLGLFVHRHTWFIANVTIAWGAALVVAAVALRCRVVRSRQQSGGDAATMALAWLLVTTVCGALDSGDTVIAGDVLGTGYVLGGALVIGVCATWPSMAERERWRARRR